MIYRASRPQDAVLAGELQKLTRWCGARLHVVLGPSTAVGEYGPMMGPVHVASLVPDVARRDVFMCGPPGMVTAIGKSLRVLGVPARQRHTERFAFAA